MGRSSFSVTAAWYRINAASIHRALRWAWPRYTPATARWLVLQSGPNPSTDYYIRPRASSAGVDSVYRDIECDAPRAADFPSGTQVVVVRYLNRRWAKALHDHAAALSGVIYFMDDDLLDPSAWIGLPQPYVVKLAGHFSAVARDLAKLTSELWVSTAELAVRYRTLEPQVVSPLPLVDDVPQRLVVDPFVRVVYHGTEAHHAEMRWLRPVIGAVLDACPQAQFEIIGNATVNRLYRDLPRTRVLHPMSWPRYLSHCRTMRAHVGLAPLLDSAFNAGRSHTKMFDVARCGAVGLYSQSAAAYRAAVRHGDDGLLLANDPNEWTRQIVALANDPAALMRLRQRAAECLHPACRECN